MEHIDSEKAEKARNFIYSGKIFKEGVREEGEIEAQEEPKKAEMKEDNAERDKRLEAAREALFNGKLFK